MTTNRMLRTIAPAVTLATLLAVVFGNPAFGLEAHRNINGPFTTMADVTAACLTCHHQQALEVLQSTHWTWVRQRLVNGKNTLYGKKDSLAGFAIDVSSNPSRCMNCHISNARPGVNLDSPAPEMVDCLVCHDTTGAYRLAAPGVPADHSADELEMMARSVGSPVTANCMTCHFKDCGLPAADQSGTTSPGTVSPFQDIHMERSGMAFACQDCHTRHSGHNFSRKAGRQNGTGASQGCASCHTETPHGIDQLNRHAVSIACKTCHIPQYAQNRPMIIGWNWIMSGRTNRIYQDHRNGRSLAQDENGFTSSTRLEPVYLWDDGGDLVYTRGQRIRPQELTFLERPAGKSSTSRISPFRAVYGTQMYDSKYRYLISPLLQPEGSALFPGSDWETVAREGMHAIVLPFSGEHAFAPTAAFRRISHGVVPADQALDCLDCHGATSRMPWQELGFEKDPWYGTSGTPQAPEGTGQVERIDTSQPAPADLQQVNEPVIPPVKPPASSF